jgi:hypothetical protein
MIIIWAENEVDGSTTILRLKYGSSTEIFFENMVMLLLTFDFNCF